MKEYGCSVWVKDNAGNALLCTLDSICSLDECNRVVGTLENNRKIPSNFEELSEHERRSCRSSVGA